MQSQILLQLGDITPNDIKRDLGLAFDPAPIDKWPADALALLLRVKQLGILGQHIDIVAQREQIPNRTRGWQAEPFVLQSLTAFQSHLIELLIDAIPFVHSIPLEEIA